MKLIFKCQILIFGVFPFLNSCTQQQIYKSRWQASDFSTISYSQIQESMHFYDNKSKLQYNITNDDKNIYICIKAADERFQMKIIHAGMQINIDTGSKMAQPVCIIYPIAGNGKPKMPLDIKPGQEKNNQIKNQFLLEHKEMQLSGFKSPINGLVPLQNKYNISVGIDWDPSNNMYYKAIIPFSTFYKEALLQEDSSKIFNITFMVNAMEMPGNKMGGLPGGNGSEMQGEGNMPTSGENMQGGGNMEKGGPPPGGGGNGMQPDNSLSEKNIIKIKIKMAVKIN
jgi:hypothetical protein